MRGPFVLVGGGTGGHIMPLLAVAQALKKMDQGAKTVYIGDHQDHFFPLVQDSPSIDRCFKIRAGKLRRFHKMGIKQLLYVNRWLLNLRDFFFVIIGFFQSLRLLCKIRPYAIFIKGGYVGVPVGLAAALLRIPMVTHDSDIVPGLANRLISRWVKVHAVGMPAPLYPYDQTKTVCVGVPIDESYLTIAQSSRSKIRQTLRLAESKPIILVVGGSLGSEKLNQTLLAVVADLSTTYQVVHVTGENSYRWVREQTDPLRMADYQPIEFIKGNMAEFIFAADLVIMRASATMLAEVSSIGRTLILIPNKLLTAGHQIQNAEAYQKKSAAMVLDEDELQEDPTILTDSIHQLTGDKKAMKVMIQAQQALFVRDSASQLAEILYNLRKG